MREREIGHNGGWRKEEWVDWRRSRGNDEYDQSKLHNILKEIKQIC